MNISEAKTQLRNALTAYFTKDEFGNFKIPTETQRPVFLMGPPGIGKTAIVKQVAEEMNVGVVSYSITHHTRQSALGLPMIITKEYNGKEYSVSEYTMSEIIASVYDVIAESGAEEGILFLDEINCASETLTPVMLQFLQFKTFGKHRLPDGWIIVTAGNPPEFNRSAKDFDIVTWDRLKRIDIEPDYQAWKAYAQRHSVHGSITSYLDIRKEFFYRLQTTPEGVHFATARGWMDLSDMIHLYEENSIPVDYELVAQYLQDPEIAEDYAAYYELYNKYKSDYQVEDILSGKDVRDIILRAKDSAFDERLSLLGLLLSGINHDFRNVIEEEDTISEILPILKEIKSELNTKKPETSTADIIAAKLSAEEHKMDQTAKRGILTPEKRLQFERTIAFLGSLLVSEKRSKSKSKDGFATIKARYDKLLAQMKEDSAETSERLRALFGFVQDAFGNGDELLILITELTSNWYSARFISRYGSEEYYSCSEQLSFHQRHLDIIERIERSDII
ncbi:MAG: AAA family ATPase [Clostridiales bacterium]|nr:AAA family ATPase [Candidatus Crickella caballi]